MRKVLRLLIAVALPMATAFAGMLLILLANPEASIDEGWRIGWIGLGGGLLVAIAILRCTFHRE